VSEGSVSHSGNDGLKWWFIAGIALSFCIGVVFFLTIAQSRSGDPIPVDAAPHYYIHDAG